MGKYSMVIAKDDTTTMRTLLGNDPASALAIENGILVLHEACKKGTTEMIKVILELGPPAQLVTPTEDAKGALPVHSAAYAGSRILIFV
jgi:ankyrin repeat protein